MLADRFEIKRTLGEGGMGVVYEARDMVRDMVVALKTLRTLDATLIYHFKNEFRSHADLHHTNLCTLYEMFEEAGNWFFTMELVDGTDFMSWVRPRDEAGDTDAMRWAPTVMPASVPTPLPVTSPDPPPAAGPARTMIGVAPAALPMPVPGVSLRMSATPVPYPAASDTLSTISVAMPFDEPRLRDALGQLAGGLNALHGAGKVHRDIKPGNILVTPQGRVVIMDFGLVADATLLAEFASNRLIAGTPMFMAPEQGVPGASVGTSADWYAVGVMLFQILTKQMPYHGDTIQELIAAKHTPPPAPGRLLPGVPDDLADLCQRLLSPDPASRPGGDEIIAVLSGGKAPRHSMKHVDVFVGRRAELGMLHTALADSRRGAVAVYVEGTSGLGKTALVRRFLDEVAGSNTLILEGRCYAEETVPYKAFDGIVDALSRYLVGMDFSGSRDLVPSGIGLAARLFPVLRRVPVISRLEEDESDALAETSGLELRARAFAALVEVFRRVSSRGPLLLFVDDLQWADADSKLLLRELLDPATAPHVMFLASVRTSAPRVSSNGMSNAAISLPMDDEPDLTAIAGVEPRRLILAPLAPEDAAMLVDRILPRDAATAERRAEIAREAAGHPLFLSELAHHLSGHDVSSGGLSSTRLDDALWDRALALDQDARHILQVIAVAGTPIAASIVSDAASLSPTRSAPMMSALRAARFVKIQVTATGDSTVEPYHDRVRESVVSRMGADKFAATSAELGHAMLRAGLGDRTPELVVRHMFAAGDAKRGGVLAERAAGRALASLAFDRAAEFLRSALAAGARDAAHQRDLYLALAEALASGGRGAESAEAFLAAGQGDAEADLDCRRHAADQFLASGHVARGLSELVGVLERLGERAPNTPQAAFASLEAERPFVDAALAPGRPLVIAARAEAEVPVNLLRRLDCCQSTSLGLILVDNVRGADFQARAVRLALEAGEPRRVLRALVFETIYRSQEGEAGRARAAELVVIATEFAAPHRDPWMEANLVFCRAFLAYYEGRFRRAVELFKDAYDRLRAFSGVAWEKSNARVHRLRATDYQGAWGELRSLYDEYLRDAERRDDRYVAASITRWFNVLWLAHDRPDLAGADLDKSPWSKPAEGGYHLQHFLELRARVELAFYRGDGATQGFWARPGLEAADKSLLFRIQIARAIADWLLGRIAACEGNVAEVDLRAQRLVDDHVNYAAIWAGLLRGAAIAQRGDVTGSIDELERVAAMCDANDFPLCAAVARLRMGQLEGGVVGAERIEASTAWMRGQEIRNPIRMCDVFAPGFRR